ncbi:hypothetical protein ED733_004296 [Metarhizium rileyi]|uniref:thioredoxin-dependent peroxiredoxin n=1 Tax=Metarhizium rileyi (strain RCEF 4871) TaxID=1649241 RepID=A0A5C6G3Z3_METRR|nr:hypothetical protein ED733_004296 [Metarhizium rileyi]
MPVELRKRKAPQPLPVPAPVAKKATKAAAKPAKAKKPEPAAKKADEKPASSAASASASASASAAAVPPPPAPAPAPTAAAAASPGKVAVGDVIDLDGFGGEIQTNDGQTTSLKKLLGESASGVVLFTYPKASTPGCTTQVCLFRDSYGPLTAGGLAIYGLSADSPKANTTFKEKQKLPYPLLCDPQATLIAAIGLKKQPKGTQRGVFVVDKKGKVLVAQPGSPAGTVDKVKTLVQGLKK